MQRKWSARAEPAGGPASPRSAGRCGAEAFDRLAARITRAPGERESLPVEAPFTGEILGRLPRGIAADVAEADRRARAAQRAWAATPVAARARALLRFHDRLLDRRDEALDLIQLESGKSRRHAVEEVADIANVTRYYAKCGPGILRPRRRRGAVPWLTATWEHRHPRGVVGVIAPWNYPLSLAVGDAIPALIAGNAVILKPDRQTSFTALWAAGLLHEAGVPTDVFQVVTGEGPEVGPALVDAVDYIAFTGSTATGRQVARQAAGRLIGATLELGGKNPLIVLGDADLDRAVGGAVRACFASAGQLCISTERVLVHASIHDRFVERFVEATRALRLGAALDYDADIGSLTSRRQLEAVEAHVRDAVAKGAAILTGGRARPDIGPLFYEPTILAGVTPAMKLYGEETFGPVVAVYAFASIDDAVERANDTRYGLNASIWTRDTALGRSVATRVQAGTVNINEGYGAAWGSVDAPMGGFKDSGVGRRHGAEGMLKYTEPQTIAVQRLIPIAPMPAIGLGPARWGDALSLLLRLLRRAPGVR